MRTISCSPTRCITSKWFVLPALALLAVAFTPRPASAQANNCLADVGPAKSCSANDVSIAAVQASSVNVFQGGFVGTNKCIAGGSFSFTADFEIKTTSNKARSNIGIFFGTGQNNALSGTCTDNIIAPPHSCAYVNGTATATCGSIGTPTGYEELDGKTNGEVTNASAAGCGDTSSTDSTTTFGASTQAVVLEVDNATCPSSGSSLALPFCTSWYQPTSTMPVCESPAPNYPWQPQAIAGTSSKCTCGVISIPVQPITPSIGVAKSCNTTLTTAANQTTCDAGPEGSTVTYTVAITNSTPSGQGGIVVDQICDDQYGTVYDDGTTGKSCPAGKIGSIISGSASSCASLGTITTSASCTFQAAQGEIATVKDIVSVSGHSSLLASATFGPTTSNQVTVNSQDNPTTVTTSLAYAPPATSACVTVRYTVTVANTSITDETATLTQVGTPNTAGYVSALQDARYGDITQDHGTAGTDGSVVGTTCGVAAGAVGQGTLAGVTAAYTAGDCVGGNAQATLGNCNGGAFPQTLNYGTGSPVTNGGLYMCQFDGVVCGSLTSGAVSGCGAGMSKSDLGVTPNITLDNGETAGTGVTYNATISPFTTNICVSEQ